MTSFWDRANPQLRHLSVYEPGKPIEETARELAVDPGEIIKLASNENPLGPSPKALKAMRTAIESAQLYPDGAGFYLREALATRFGLSPENIVLGNGSNEIIEFVGHAFLSPGDDVVTPAHAFIAYKLAAQLFGARTIEAGTPNFQPDLNLLRAGITPRTKVIFIANPNNPTGALISPDQVEAFLNRVPEDVIVVLDEAYFEYLDEAPNTLGQIARHPSLLVLRTFSKIHGLASLRLGYGVASRDLIEVLQKTRQPFNVNGVAQVAALAALDDGDYVMKSKRVVDQGRAFLEQEFRALKLKFGPSAGNFVFVNVGDGLAVFKRLLAKNIIVRPLRGYNLPEWLRVTVGTMEQNQRCIAALKEVMS